MTQTITKTSVALGPIDRQIVQKLARSKGLNFSSALRVIIREWKQMQTPPPEITNKPSIAE